VKDAQVLSGYAPGEAVVFELEVTREDAVIVSLVSTHPTAALEDGKGERPADNAAWIHIPRIGEPIPDIVLTNQDGRRVHLRGERGKVLALNFIYTHCPLPTFCPRAMREFSVVKRELGERVGRDVELFSVTFDPVRDTPGILKNYASGYGAATPGWQMLTGLPEEVKKAVSFFDVNYWSSPSGVIKEHTLSIVVVDRQGRVARFYTGNTYDAHRLVNDIHELLAEKNE
jgi:protein SCO1/2